MGKLTVRICDVHYDEIVAAVTARGLSAFIRPKELMTAADAARVAEKMNGGVLTRANYEPVNNAQAAIVHHFCLLVGDAVSELALEDCPLCFLVQGCGCKRDDCFYLSWVAQAADEQLEDAKTLGLMGSA